LELQQLWRGLELFLSPWELPRKFIIIVRLDDSFFISMRSLAMQRSLTSPRATGLTLFLVDFVEQLQLGSMCAFRSLRAISGQVLSIALSDGKRWMLTTSDLVPLVPWAVATS